VSCDVILEESDAEVILPRGALFAGDTTQGKASKPYVFVQAGKGTWVQREVELGIENAVQVVVKSGLKQGDVVALELPPNVGKESKRQAAVSDGRARRAARES